jgi:mannose-6-phosphate isomerase-like protein (cupin superfamily)
MNDFVPKPWGREYLCWESEECAIWVLEIDKNKSTSFHCHTEKNTGLVVLEGEVNLKLINSEYNLKVLEKINIFRGRFHQSTAIGERKAVMIEVEAPVNKKDLIRWEDSNGRKNSLYEVERKNFEKSEEIILLGNKKSYNKTQIYKNLTLDIYNFEEYSISTKKHSLYILLDGAIVENQDKIVIPGDTMSNEVLNKLLNRFTLTSDALLLCINLTEVSP